MASDGSEVLFDVMTGDKDAILADWSARLKASSGQNSGRMRDAELLAQARTVLDRLCEALGPAGTDRDGPAWTSLDHDLAEMSRSRALQGFTAAETADFVLSSKEPVLAALTRAHAGRPEMMVDGILAASRLLDRLALRTVELYQVSREEVIDRQNQEISELSTPVVRLWRGILALPLIGTLDSARTGVVMETLLQAIVDQEAEIAIIDITGVPTVDTMVAQHLLKTIAAARLMGADCLISGIRPQIAQTMVHLGVELDVVSKSNLADAFALALKRTGRMVVSAQGRAPEAS